MFKQIYSIATYTLLEALRNRLSWLMLIVALLGIGLSGFLNALALTESQATQLALLAAFLRFSAAFLLATFVVTSMVREFNDKVMELILSRPIRRSSYFFGQLGGFALVALVLALLFSLPLALFAPAPRVALWGLSLACELLIMTSVSLFCVLSLAQVLSALAAVTGFYLLGRAIGALQIIAANPLADGMVPGQQFINLAVDAIAFLLPGLDRMTQTSWLIYAAPTSAEILGLLAQTAVYLLFLCSAALFDLQRKNF